MRTHPSRTVGTLQVILGLFIAWQIFFFFAANLLKYLEYLRPKWKDQPIAEQVAAGWMRQKGHANDAVQVILGLTNRWAQFTGQPQDWSLFAPAVTDRIPFVAVELRWEEEAAAPSRARVASLLAGTNAVEASIFSAAFGHFSQANTFAAEMLPSENEPKNLHRYLRFGNFRLRRFEANLDPGLSLDEGQTIDEATNDWAERIESHVQHEWRAIIAYLRWRVQIYMRAHPDRPMPRQVVLLQKMYIIPPPEKAPTPWTWNLNLVLPLARWQPDAPWDAKHLPIEMYNPLLLRFESVKRDND